MAYATTILGLSLLIILHELGHFLVARACGMRVLKFSIGFGPALFKRRIGETLFQIASVPLGGFVLIDGMGPADDDRVPDARTFRSKPVWMRTAVIFAGPAMNWILAAVFISTMAMSVGYLRATTQLANVVPDQPAAAAGLRAGDRIVSVDGEAIVNWSALVTIIERSADTALQVVVEREGDQLTLTVTPVRQGAVGKIGVEPDQEVVRVGLATGALVGFTAAWEYTHRQVGMLWGMLRGKQKGQLSGPVGIVKMVSAQAERGIRWLIQTLAWLSVTLAILNLAPIPALDGGRLVFLTLETIRGRPVDERLEGLVHGVGFLLLFGVLILVTMRDIFG